jgi:hypothetical protein
MIKLKKKYVSIIGQTSATASGSGQKIIGDIRINPIQETSILSNFLKSLGAGRIFQAAARITTHPAAAAGAGG